MTTPTDELRAAATKLREKDTLLRAEAIPPQQPLMWFAEDLITGSTLVGANDGVLDHPLTAAEAEWLALASPVLAGPLAELLDAEADGWPPPPVHTSTEPAARRRRAALALARAVNGTEP